MTAVSTYSNWAVQIRLLVWSALKAQNVQVVLGKSSSVLCHWKHVFGPQFSGVRKTGWFPKGGFGRFPGLQQPGTMVPEQGYKNRCFWTPKARNEGTKNGAAVQKDRNEGTFAKTALLQTALLFPLKVLPKQQQKVVGKGDMELGVFKRPLTLILLLKYRHTNGSTIAIQIGGVYTTFNQEDGILLQKHRDRNRRCIAILSKVSGSGVDAALLMEGSPG